MKMREDGIHNWRRNKWKREEFVLMRQLEKGEKESVRKGEPGCRGALPGICVVHAFQPGGSKPGKRRAHTHTHICAQAHTLSVHTQTYIIIPKGEIFIEYKNTLYTPLHDIYKI